MQRKIGEFISPVIRSFSQFVWKTPKPLNNAYQEQTDIDEASEAPSQDPSELQVIITRKEPSASTSALKETQEISPVSNQSATITARQVISKYSSFIFARENLPRIALGAVTTAAITIANIAASSMLGSLFDTVNNKNEDTQEEDQLFMQIAWVFGAYAFAQTLPVLRDLILNPVAANNTAAILTMITENQLKRRSLYYHNATEAGKKIYLIQQAFGVSDIGTRILTNIGPGLFEISLAVAALSSKYGIFIGAGLSTTLALYTIYSAVTTKPIIKAREEMVNRGRESWTAIDNAISRYKVIHDFNKIQETMDQVKTKIVCAAKAEINVSNKPLQIGMGHIAISRLGMLGTALAMAVKFQSNQLSAAEFIGIIAYLNQLSTSLPELGRAMNQVFAGYPVLEYVFNELSKPSEILDLHPDHPLKMNGPPKITFENVKFNFPKKSPVCNDLSFTIEPGQTVALVSQSGGGKSTIFNLLYRYYDCSSGKIYINDENIADLSRHSLQEQIGIVSQNPNLFHGTVRENIKFGAKNENEVKDEDIYQLAVNLNLVKSICELSGEEEEIVDFQTFVKGLNANVGEGGKALSGGQQQKVAILRGFIEDKPIRLLDEITSALDSDSADKVLKGVERLSKNTTTLVISHHLYEITNIDKILVIENGRIIAEGRHAELLEHCEVYKNLWDQQNNAPNNDQEKLLSTASTGLFHRPKQIPVENTTDDAIELPTLETKITAVKNN